MSQEDQGVDPRRQLLLEGSLPQDALEGRVLAMDVADDGQLPRNLELGHQTVREFSHVPWEPASAFDVPSFSLAWPEHHAEAPAAQQIEWLVLLGAVGRKAQDRGEFHRREQESGRAPGEDAEVLLDLSLVGLHHVEVLDHLFLREDLAELGEEGSRLRPGSAGGSRGHSRDRIEKSDPRSLAGLRRCGLGV